LGKVEKKPSTDHTQSFKTKTGQRITINKN